MHRTDVLVPGILLLLPLLLPGPLLGQEEHRSFRLSVSPSVQIQGYSSLGGVVGTLYGGIFGGTGAASVSARERRVAVTVRASNAPHTALAAEWRIAGPVVLRAAAGRQETALDLAVRTALPDGSDVRRASMKDLGNVTVWTGSLGVQWRLADGAPVRPYVGLSAGASHWVVAELDRAPLGLLVDDDRLARTVRATLPAGEATAGFDVPLGGRLRLRLEVSDHVSVNPWRDRSVHLRSSFEGTGSAEDLVHTLRGGVGLGIRLF